MKLIVGLGNPGARYNFTRHNVGFLTLDYFAKLMGLRWNEAPKFNAIWIKQDDILYVKPQSFYNETGTVVANFLNYYKIDYSDLLVICDNFDLKFGLVRFRNSGSAGGNNGIKSIDASLKTSDYARIRIGTGNDDLRKKIGDIDFVLSRFTPDERAQLPGILQMATDKINDFIRVS